MISLLRPKETHMRMNRNRLARSKANRLKALVDEVSALRGMVVNQEILSTAKDEAMRNFVNAEIARWNAAIRATNGPKRGESQDLYRKRLVEANKINQAS